ncbi:MAG: hypothetical protein ACP5E4_03110 [Candidatus Aenigmatarchaeota archaeon]
MKAQSSVEFLILFSVLALIFALAINYFFAYIVHSGNSDTERQYKDLCVQVREEIENALLFDGYYRRPFYLPGGDYTIDINGREIAVSYSAGRVVCLTPVNMSHTELNKGENVIIYNGEEILFE